MEVRNIHRIIKVGNSLAAVLPRAITKALNIKRGDLVVLGCVQDDVIYIRKATARDVQSDNFDTIDFSS